MESILEPVLTISSSKFTSLFHIFTGEVKSTISYISTNPLKSFSANFNGMRVLTDSFPRHLWAAQGRDGAEGDAQLSGVGGRVF